MDLRSTLRMDYNLQIADISPLSGQRSKNSPHLLQGSRLQETYATQGHPIQGRKGQMKPTSKHDRSNLTHSLGLSLRTRKAPIRSQTVRLRWSDEARVPQEGEDNEKGRVEVGVHSMQDKGSAVAEAMQTFRAGVRTADCILGKRADMVTVGIRRQRALRWSSRLVHAWRTLWHLLLRIEE